MAAAVAVVSFTVRQMFLIGHACRRAAIELVQQLPPGSRIVVRFGGAELQLLVACPQALPGRSETDT